MLSLFKKPAATTSRQLKKYNKTVNQINQLEAVYEKMSDDELRSMTNRFRERLADGEKLESITPEAFAVVREASKRVLGMRHFDVQMIGGLVMAEGNIAEMATGEGKTLVASLPSYVRALSGKGVHVITVNDYLARRDFEQIGQIHQFLGLDTGLNVPMMDPEAKKAAYQADITYGVGTEFGFDYLRDNLVAEPDQKVQRPYHFAIIDEVDSVLIDEAKTPLIIAGKMEPAAELHRIAALLMKRFEMDIDYDFDPETKAVTLTDAGITKVEKAFGIDNLYEMDHQTLYHYVIQAVRAHVIFKKDVDYIITEDGKIALVDMFTGRIMEGRSLSDGLHQAIEAKEGVEITEENKAQSQITIQNYFRMYPGLCGMTGTAKTQEKEFRSVYGMEVIQVPTNRPKQRIDQPDRVYMTTHDKYEAVALEVKERHATGQPILVGTTSILQSEAVAEYLDKHNLPYHLLNAKSVEQEIQLIADAGQYGTITVATNMAGRGTDIQLGEGSAEAGGLYVIGTEKHESRRIDNQLRGRSGRQGDPGESRFFISLEDDMYRRFAKDDTEKFKKNIKTDDVGLILNNSVHELTERTQRIVEGAHFSQREYNLKLDDVINDQRKVVFGFRNQALDGNRLPELLDKLIDDTIDFEIEEHAPQQGASGDWNLKQLETVLASLLPDSPAIDPETSRQKELHSSLEGPVTDAKEQLNELLQDEQYSTAAKRLILSRVDTMWVRHLEAMTRMKEGIGLRRYQQEDPMRIYQREGLHLFAKHFQEMRRIIIRDMKRLLEQQQEAIR
ncbi:accessory Sec system translocase SecA2 [Bhargavaea ginsengi]|uniref:accessory Sec system translocase SecA2 n=1 Tax=Bhargavaea ginsengi TaxID=426757 RepID=UPI0020413448|nr:accessory Sec system translocase SecA2 [Bhargavaea ginsengi]MCM3088112.1 accessory Sec system translocase SecA2 [Bhargavaea ginsengi]